MLSFENRLTKSKDFEKVFKEGETFHSDFLVVNVLKEEKGKRFGFIVSKKVSLKATVRNKIKRRLREQVRLIIPLIQEDLTAIIIAKKEIVGKSSEEIKQELKNIFL